MHLSSAPAALVSPVSGSCFSCCLFSPCSRLPVHAGASELLWRLLSEPRRQPRDAGADLADAHIGGGGAAQGERHEVSLWVWGTLSRQHPGGVQHWNYQDSACSRGRLITVNFFLISGSWRGFTWPQSLLKSILTTVVVWYVDWCRLGGAAGCGFKESIKKSPQIPVQVWSKSGGLSNVCSLTNTPMHLSTPHKARS